MKILKRNICLLVLMVISVSTQAQNDWNAAGVWTGRLYNDTTKKFIPFEIAISYHNGKYSGYTYTVFLIDSMENIGVKEVTIKVKNDQWIIKDKKLVDDNYRDDPAKGVYTTIELLHSENDTTDVLSGRWFTNKTKEFYPLTGTVRVSKQKNIFVTRIVPKLRDLGLADDLSFFSYSTNVERVAKNENKEVVGEKQSKDSMITIVEPELVITIPKSKTKELKLPDADVLKEAVDSVTPVKKDVEKIEKKKQEKNFPNQNNQPNIKVAPLKKDAKDEQRIVKIKTGKEPEKAIREKNKLPEDTVLNNVAIKWKNAEEPKPVKNIQLTEKTEKLSDSTLQKRNILSQQTKQLGQQPPVPKIDLSNRKIETIRTVAVSGDSLVLSLFDNGAVDGDTVSVLLNGSVVISKIGLLEKAFNQTIHLAPDMGDSIRIVLYAENLGSIAPNTGLLVVRNAGRDYEIRFSGDLTKNSAIILLRNKKE